MKVALVHTTLPNPARGMEGGVTFYVHRLANHLVRAGHDVTVFSVDPAPPDAEYEVRPLPAPAWATSGFVGRMLALPWFLYRLPRHEFDVIHTHGDDSFFWSRRRIRSLHGSALGELRSAVSWRRRLGQALLYPLELLSAVTAARAIVQSETTRRHFPFVKSFVPYSVDVERFRPGPKSAVPSILFVGSLRGRKRGELVVQEFMRVVRPALPDAELWMAADRDVEAAGVVNLGKVYDEQRFAKLFGEAWLFCMPSTYEGFGLPYVEALAAGTPVVTTSNPGAEEILAGGRGGLIVPESLLGAALLELLESPDRREALQAAGLERAQDFAWDRATTRLTSIYREVAGG